MSKVSVIVPIYNAGSKLDKCIKSILNQTFKDIEIILVNDGSTDNSLKVCRNYQQQDQRVILIDKKNEGSIATRRKGVEVSRSDFITFVDADDWIDRRMIEELYMESINDGNDITVCNSYRVLGNGLVIKKKNTSEYFSQNRIFNKEEIKNELVAAFFHGHPFPPTLYAKIYKRELVLNSGKYLDRICFLGEDLFYNLEIFLKAKKVKIIDKPLYYYRYGGFTSKYMPCLFDDMINGYKILKEVIDEYYQDSLQKRSNGISVMLLNTFQTCLYNLFNGEKSVVDTKKLIREYAENETVNECLRNEGAINYFSSEYLKAIETRDIEYLYQLGEKIYKSKKPKKALIKVLSGLSFL